jgi:membrane-associated phospholipid phosphatase
LAPAPAQDRWGAIAALLAAGGALGINLLISDLWYRARPFVAHPTVHLLVSHTRDASFPSDHAAAGFAIAAVLFSLHRRLGVVALASATFISYARVYVGDHYPGDVAAGLVVGVAVAVLMLTWLRPVATLLAGWVDRLLQLVRLLPAAGPM